MPEALLFSCEFCEIFKNTFFTEHLFVTVSLDLLYFHYHGYVIYLIIPVISENIIPIMSKVIRFF